MTTTLEFLPPAIDTDALSALMPIGALSSAQRETLTTSAMVYDLAPGDTLDGGMADLGESLFLLSGTLEIHPASGNALRLRAGEAAACFALYPLARAG
ncbi:MAG: hypothetical protein KIT13_02950, partial [Burkholderiales bacterium]|nr:hypothetical protein [Burkholderiales bacterium]